MISVCMATYNGEKYIGQQIKSILCQLHDNDELIVSDDGSTDRTLEILCSFNDDRIKIYHSGDRKGVVGNFENALMKSHGDYIFLSDQDDVWLEGKVKKCIEELQKVDLVMHDAIIVDAKNNMIAPSFFAQRGSRTGYLRNLIKNSYIGCCMAFNSKVRDRVIPFADKIVMHDIYIGLKAERNFEIALIKEPLLMYRRHENNASPTGQKSNLSHIYQLSYRIVMFFKTYFK